MRDGLVGGAKSRVPVEESGERLRQSAVGCGVRNRAVIGAYRYFLTADRIRDRCLRLLEICEGVASFSSFSGRLRAPTQTATVPEAVLVALATLKAPTSLGPFLPIILTKTRASDLTALLLRRLRCSPLARVGNRCTSASMITGTVACNTRSRLDFCFRWFSPYFTICFSLMCFTKYLLASRCDCVPVSVQTTRLFYDFFVQVRTWTGTKRSFVQGNKHETRYGSRPLMAKNQRDGRALRGPPSIIQGYMGNQTFFTICFCFLSFLEARTKRCLKAKKIILL
jgi:hypothetical protein